ncbi:MAG: TonB-dependent receptor [Flavobacteriales bacterium]|nr:TonB-dependent receptor [Flavobacteriales bacterium]
MIRIKEIILLLLFFIGFSTQVDAQKMKITGYVVDTSGKIKLENVSVLAVRMRDSLLMKFTRTNKEGFFELSNFPADTFSLVVEHPQFESKSYFIFGNKDNNEINIPVIRMGEKLKALDEVVIYANKNAIFYRGDTLVYVADSFKVGENAVVEDLLKKLPGLKIDKDGKITSQGKEISQVLVDGDEFFGTDPTIATKNLAAKGVESVQIYEKKNEDAKAGEDEKIQVLDLKLKEDAKKGYFGKISGASDFGLMQNNPFYEGEMLLNKFNKRQKISVFLLTSNTPRSNFGWGDMNKFGLENESAGTNFWDRGAGTNTSGVPKTLKAGFYYSDKIGKTGKIGFNYSYYNNQLDSYSSSRSQYFLQDSSYFTKDSTRNSSQNQSHNINLSYKTNIDSLTYLEIKPNFKIDIATTDNKNLSSFRDENYAEYLSTSVQNINNSEGLSSNSEALLRRKFRKPKRELELKYILDLRNNNTDGNLLTYTKLAISPDSTVIDQKKGNKNSSITNYGIVTYTEPLSKLYKLEVEYLFENTKSNQDKKSFNRGNGSYTEIVTGLTNNFDITRYQNRGTASLIYEKGKHTISGGLGYRYISIENKNIAAGTTINQNINNFLPKASYFFKPSMSKRLSINYRTYSDAPSVNDLQPVPDNSNPNRIREGNPDLKPNYVHSLRANFNTWQALSGRYLWSGLDAALTNNDFATQTTYDPFGRTVSKTVNVNGNFSSSLWIGGGIPVLNRKIEISPKFFANYNRYQNYINGQLNVTQNTSVNGGVELKFILDSLEISIENDFNYTNPVSSLSSVSNQPYTSQNYNLRLDYQLPWHFKLKINADYTINSRRAVGFNRNIFVLNAEVSKAFFPTENLILSINANDIFNQNLNLQRQVNGNIITDNYTRIISRYFLLKLTFKFNNNKTKEDDFNGWH